MAEITAVGGNGTLCAYFRALVDIRRRRMRSLLPIVCMRPRREAGISTRSSLRNKILSEFALRTLIFVRTLLVGCANVVNVGDRREKWILKIRRRMCCRQAGTAARSFSHAVRSLRKTVERTTSRSGS